MQPSKLNQNAHVERFNRTFPEELVNQRHFVSLAVVPEATHWWMIEDNEERPHDALDELTPVEACQQATENSSSELWRLRKNLRDHPKRMGNAATTSTDLELHLARTT